MGRGGGAGGGRIWARWLGGTFGAGPIRGIVFRGEEIRTFKVNPVGQGMGIRVKVTKERTMGLQNWTGANGTNVGRFGFRFDRTRVRMDIA